MKRLPTEAVNSKPMLCIMRGYFLYGAGETKEAERFYGIAEDLITSGQCELGSDTKHSGEDISAYWSTLAGKLAAVRAIMHSFSGDVKETKKYSDLANKSLSHSELVWRAVNTVAIGEIHAFLCDMAAAEKTQTAAIEAGKAVDRPYFWVVATHRLIETLLEQGRLLEALEMCREQLRSAEEFGLTKSSFAGSWFVTFGEILDQTGDAGSALANVTKGMKLEERSDYLPVHRCCSYVSAMRVLLAHSRFSEIEVIIQKIRAIARESHAPDWVAHLAEMWQARVWLEQGRIDLASRWMERRDLQTADLSDELELFQFQEFAIAGRALIAEGRLEEAHDLLTKLHLFAEANGLVTRDIEILCLSALALQAQGDTEQAMDTIERTIRLAEQGGLVRSFVAEGPKMARLLYEAASKGISTQYVRTLLAMFPAQQSEEAERPHIQAANNKMFEPLSDRELGVLRLIAEGLSNEEIGNRLFISLHTVKAHARNINSKLETHTRTQAVSKARGLGLLPTV